MSRNDTGKIIGTLAIGTLVAITAGFGAIIASTIEKDRKNEEKRQERVIRETVITEKGRLHELKWITSSDPGFSGDDVNPEIYLNLLNSSSSKDEEVILRDIDRTMPSYAIFQEGGAGRRQLRNILTAYSRWDPDVGYVQGMNYIVGYLLRHMSEEQAFIMLVRIMQQSKYNLRGCFQEGLPMQHELSYVIKRLVDHHFPRLASHFRKEGITFDLFLQEWVTLYTYSARLPEADVVAIWDSFFESGWSIVIRVFLVILESVHDALLGMGMMEIVGYLHTLHKNDDRISDDEPRIYVPSDLIRRAIEFKVHENEIEKLQNEYKKNHRKK